MLVDVEEPHHPLVTIPLAEAMDTYALTEGDVDRLKDGAIVWYKDVALTLHLDD